MPSPDRDQPLIRREWGSEPAEGLEVHDLNACGRRKEALRQLGAFSTEQVFAFLDDRANRRAGEADPELARILIAAGLSRSMDPEEYNEAAEKAGMFSAAKRAYEKASENVEGLSEQAGQLEERLGSVWFRIGCALSFRWGKVGETERQLESVRSDAALAEKNLTKTRSRFEISQQASESIAAFSPTSAGPLALTAEGEARLQDYQSSPSIYSNRSVLEALNLFDSWANLKEGFQRAYAHGRVEEWPAAQMAITSARSGVEIDDLLRAFDEAYAHSDVNSVAAAQIACAAVSSGKPVGPYLSAFDKAYEVQGVNSFSAAFMAVAAVSNEASLSEMLQNWGKFYELEGLDSISATVMAASSVRYKLSVPELIAGWREAWKIEGLKSISAAQLSIFSLKEKVELGGLLDAWKKAWEAEGCDSNASSQIAMEAMGPGGCGVQELISKWKTAYAASNVNASAAASLAKVAASGKCDLSDLLYRFADAYSINGLGSGCAGQLVHQWAVGGPQTSEDGPEETAPQHSSDAYESSYSSDPGSGFDFTGALAFDLVDDGQVNLSTGFLLGGALGLFD